jgi:hypothetical protein
MLQLPKAARRKHTESMRRHTKKKIKNQKVKIKNVEPLCGDYFNWRIKKYPSIEKAGSPLTTPAYDMQGQAMRGSSLRYERQQKQVD